MLGHSSLWDGEVKQAKQAVFAPQSQKDSGIADMRHLLKWGNSWGCQQEY